MKNLAKSAVLVLALGAMSVISCTKNEDPATSIKPKAVETTSATIALSLPAKTNPTGKTVNGGLYAWINEIDVTTKSNDFTYAAFMTPFTMTADPIGFVEANGDIVVGNYRLDGVALGSNDFTAVTKCSTPQILSFEQTTVDGATRVASMKGKNPYAIYGCTLPHYNVVKGVNTLPSTMLTTTHGRAIGVFQIDPALTALGVYAKVSYSNGTPQPQTQYINVDGDHRASFYWSNAGCTDGAAVTFTVDLYNLTGKFNTFTAVLNVVGSSSVNNLYTIKESDIITNTGIDLFTAQPWLNQDGTPTIGN
jgi:hypothetical protein